MKKYEKPIMEVVHLNCLDVITASGYGENELPFVPAGQSNSPAVIDEADW